jgi:hypothetical protein
MEEYQSQGLKDLLKEFGNLKAGPDVGPWMIRFRKRIEHNSGKLPSYTSFNPKNKNTACQLLTSNDPHSLVFSKVFTNHPKGWTFWSVVSILVFFTGPKRYQIYDVLSTVKKHG